MKRLFPLLLLWLAACRTVSPTSPGAQTPAQPEERRNATTAVEPAAQPDRVYRTMLSLPCGIVDARTVVCYPRRRRGPKRHTLGEAFGPQARFVHLERLQDRACALVRPSGQVVCWNDPRGPGDDESAELAVAPVEGAVDFDLLDEGMCVLKEAGEVWCWGKNDGGQLGDGSREAREVPALVALPERAIDVEAAWDGACAQLASGEIHCWGGNSAPGDPRRARPTKIRGLPKNVRLTSTSEAVTPNGERWEWHDLDHVPHRGFTSATRIEDDARRSLSCWRAADELWCSTGPEKSPQRLLENVAEVDLRNAAYCARLEDGSVWCVGHSLTLENAAPEFDFDEPTRVPGLADVTAVAMAYQGACAIHDGGRVSCWGNAPTAHPPNQNPTFVGTPVRTPLPGAARDIVVTQEGACALVDDRAWCWSTNGKVVDYGLADRLTLRARHPCYVTKDQLRCVTEDLAWYRDAKVRKLPVDSGDEVRNFGTRCRTRRGKARCEGLDEQLACPHDEPDAECTLEAASQEPPGDAQSFGINVRGDDELIVGAGVVCSLSARGGLRCAPDPQWSRRIPVVPNEPQTDIEQASAGMAAMCAVRAGGKVQCWGTLKVHDSQPTATEPKINDARSVHVGGSSACAIRQDGSLWCWGGSEFGERGLGGGSWSESWTPIRIEALQASD